MDTKDSSAVILPTGYTFNMHFERGNVDWDHMFIMTSYLSESTDKPIVLRFNYTETRELYENIRVITGHKLDLYPRVSELS